MEAQIFLFLAILTTMIFIYRLVFYFRAAILMNTRELEFKRITLLIFLTALFWTGFYIFM